MKFKVYRYYASFVSYEIVADSKEEAYEKTEELEIDKMELHTNALDWRNADIVEQIEKEN